MIFGNDSLAAELALDDLLTLCPGTGAAIAHDRHGEAVDLTEACAVLRRWDRRMDLDSRGAALFAEFFMPLTRQPGGFPAATVPFDPADPLHTPRGLDLSAEHAEGLRTGLAEAVRALASRGVALDAPWGSVQHAVRGEEKIPVHGGSGMLGVLNMQESPWREGVGYVPVHGSSYMQIVTFDPDGPVADAVLSYSQSTDPASPHYADQTKLYSAKRWNRLPFTPAQVRAEQVSVEHLRGTTH